VRGALALVHLGKVTAKPAAVRLHNKGLPDLFPELMKRGAKFKRLGGRLRGLAEIRVVEHY
jgi:hypothetical protein